MKKAEGKRLKAEGRNMHGMTEREIQLYMERGWACVVAAVCVAAAAVLVAGWLVYLACCRWPAAGHWCPVLGWTSAVYAAAVAAGKLVIGRV